MMGVYQPVVRQEKGRNSESKGKHYKSCHAKLDLASSAQSANKNWMPAYAGMTTGENL
jgi:hypothetical protein